MRTYIVHTHLNRIFNASVLEVTVAKEAIFLLNLKNANCHYINTNLFKSNHCLLLAVPLSSLSFSVVSKGSVKQFFLLLDTDGSLIPSG